MPNDARNRADEAARLEAAMGDLSARLEALIGPTRMHVFRSLVDAAIEHGHEGPTLSLPMVNWDENLGTDRISGPDDSADYRFELNLISSPGGDDLQVSVNILPDGDMSQPEVARSPQLGVGFEVNRGLPVAMLYEDPLGGDVMALAYGMPPATTQDEPSLLLNIVSQVQVERDDQLQPSLTGTSAHLDEAPNRS